MGSFINYGLNRVANRFGILKFLLAYNNNKIISENVGKSYFSYFVHWTLAPGSWLLAPGSWLLTPDHSRYDVSVWWPTAAQKCGLQLMSKMADVSLLFVTCELSYNSGSNNSFHESQIGFLLFVLFSPKTT